MSVTKEHYNAACKRVQQIDQKLGKLVHQVSEARVRALDAATKAEAWKSTAVPIDAPIERHMAAAGESGTEYARHEGQRKYWAGFHVRLMPELIATREEAVQAELDCVETARQFWDDRFQEQARAFFSRNEDVLRDIYGTLVVLRRREIPLDEFWVTLLLHAPQNDARTGRPEVFLPGAKAAERILPPPPVAENLRPDERNAVRSAMNGFVNEAHQYGTSSTRLEELVQLELKLAEAKRTTNRESERSIEIEQRRAGQAGGIGTQNPGAAAAGPATSAGRGSTGGGSRDATQVVSVTINGLPTDRASVRTWVNDILIPELDRVSRLSR